MKLYRGNTLVSKRHGISSFVHVWQMWWCRQESINKQKTAINSLKFIVISCVNHNVKYDVFIIQYSARYNNIEFIVLFWFQVNFVHIHVYHFQTPTSIWYDSLSKTHFIVSKLWWNGYEDPLKMICTLRIYMQGATSMHKYIRSNVLFVVDGNLYIL